MASLRAGPYARRATEGRRSVRGNTQMSWTIDVLRQLGDPRLEGIAALVKDAREEPAEYPSPGNPGPANSTSRKQKRLRSRHILFRDAFPLDDATQELLEGAPLSLVIPDLDIWRALAGTCVPKAPDLPGLEPAKTQTPWLQAMRR